MIFANRKEAGRKLGDALIRYKNKKPVVLGLARGGVPVAFEVAKKLEAPLDVLVVRKLGVPNAPEFGFGAVAPGILVLDKQIVMQMGITEAGINSIREKEEGEIKRRLEKYRGGRSDYHLKGNVVILVDDGVATGVSAKAGVIFVKNHSPKSTVLATPVSARDTYKELKEIVDEFVCLHVPEYFNAVGEWYQSFEQTTDEEVINFLKLAKK